MVESTSTTSSRIRIVTHAPLPRIKAWFHFNPNWQIKTLQQHVLELIPGENDIEIELEGFTLLSNSPCSILNPSKDVLDIKSVSPPAQPRALAGASAPPPTVKANSRHQIGSDCATRQSSPNEPERISSKRPNSAAVSVQSSRPSKRSRVETARTANVDNVESDSDSTSSSSPSSCSSDSSSSSTSSSSSSSSSSDSGSSTYSTVKKTTTPAPMQTKQPVSPGQGLKRTAKRNKRRRVLKAAKEAAKLAAQREAAETADTPVPRVASQAVAQDVLQTPSEKGKPWQSDAGQAKATDKASRTSSPKLGSAPDKSSKALPLDPYYDLHVSKLDMLHSAAANKKKKKGPAQTGSTKRIHCDDDDCVPKGSQDGIIMAAGATTRTIASTSASAAKVSKRPQTVPKGTVDKVDPPTRYRMVSPDLSALVHTIPDAVESRTRSPTTLKASTLTPSQRRDLPPHIQVSWVDVEQQGWEAGIGQIAQGTSSHYSHSCSAMAPQPVQPGTSLSAAQAKAPAKGPWPPRAEVERSLDSGLLPLVDSRSVVAGQLVATRVLELDPVTFAPVLSLKYGKLVKAVASDGLVSIKLHADCIPVFDGEAENWINDSGATGDYGRTPRIKFGQGVDAEGHYMEPSDVWEGETLELRLVR